MFNHVILSVDSSGFQIRIALQMGDKIVEHNLFSHKGLHDQAGKLLPAIQDFLKEYKVEIKDLNLVATTAGPGSFTGIRLGLALAQGLCFGGGVNSFCPTTMAVAAFVHRSEREILVQLPTQQRTFYLQHFDKDMNACSDIFIGSGDDIQEFLSKHADIELVDGITKNLATGLIHYYHFLVSKNAEIPRKLSPVYKITPNYKRLDRFEKT